MIMGLLIIGSALGLFAFGLASLLGYPFLTAVLAYLLVGAASVIFIAVGCAFRPRGGRTPFMQKAPIPTVPEPRP